MSFAGRVARPARTPIPRRIGGFGGVEGFREYLRVNHITHVVDATHPFAAQMSRTAVTVCSELGLPLIAFTREPWSPVVGDHWTHVPDIDAAVTALEGLPRRVMLAVGRLSLPAFEAVPQHFYLLRLIDPPKAPPAFPKCDVILDRGPFDVASDTDVIGTYGIDLVVSKNSGGQGAYAKIAAARNLHIPVLMIDRPPMPECHEAFCVQDVLSWLHGETVRGV